VLFFEVFNPPLRPGPNGLKQFELGAVEVSADVRPRSEDVIQALEKTSDRATRSLFPCPIFTLARLP
jgi:hypothetical protein